MASMKDIKLRIKSVESTMQITKAMQLVAASKLRRARERMEASQPFLQLATDTMNAAAAGMDGKGVYFVPKSDKRLYVIVAGDRGLAGGYNSNVFKLVAEHAAGEAFQVLPIGKKAMERYGKIPGCAVSTDYPVAEVVTVGHAFRMAEMVLNGYTAGDYGQVYLVYTRFDSMLTQTASLTQLLPLTVPQKGEVNVGQVLVEQEPEEILKAVLPFIAQYHTIELTLLIQIVAHLRQPGAVIAAKTVLSKFGVKNEGYQIVFILKVIVEGFSAHIRMVCNMGYTDLAEGHGVGQIL